MNGEPHEAKLSRLKYQIGLGHYHVDAIPIAKAVLKYKNRDENLENPWAQRSLQARRVSWWCPTYSPCVNGQRKANPLGALFRLKNPLC